MPEENAQLVRLWIYNAKIRYHNYGENKIPIESS